MHQSSAGQTNQAIAALASHPIQPFHARPAQHSYPKIMIHRLLIAIALLTFSQPANAS